MAKFIILILSLGLLTSCGDCDCTKTVTKSDIETGEIYSVDTITDYSSNCKSVGSASSEVDGVLIESVITCKKK